MSCWAETVQNVVGGGRHVRERVDLGLGGSGVHTREARQRVLSRLGCGVEGVGCGVWDLGFGV